LDNAELNRHIDRKTESSYFGYWAAIGLLLVVNAALSVYECRSLVLLAQVEEEDIGDSYSGQGSTLIGEEP
jgi:hypothetical protein